jgi:hypothetical protein
VLKRVWPAWYSSPMQVISPPKDVGRPETLIHRLAKQLGRHVLWDSLLIFVPPLAVLVCAIAILFWAASLEPLAAFFTIAAVVALGVFAIALRYRPRVPSVSAAAHLMDQRSGGQDHFLTLATIESENCPASLVIRLRGQTAALVSRVELKRDFPYRLKPSAYWSLGGSLVAAILIYFLAPLSQPANRHGATSERLRQLAREMASKSTLRTLGRDLQSLAAKLEDPKTSQEEKQALTQEIEKKIEEQQKREEQKDNRDLLGQASSALEGAEQQAVSGQTQKDLQKGGGGIQSNLPQEGRGDSKQSEGGGGDSKNDSVAQSNTDTQQGKPSQTKPKDGEEKGPQQGDARDPNQADSSQANKKQNKEQPTKTQGGSKEGAGKDQASNEPPPQGTPPADRFYQAGEGKEGIKGARYVTVQLPEDLVADSKGETRATRESKGSRTRSQIPVSNVPLPAHVPNAPTEKQQLPIEYRGMIR